jgi:hypothetical protein
VASFVAMLAREKGELAQRCGGDSAFEGRLRRNKLGTRV